MAQKQITFTQQQNYKKTVGSALIKISRGTYFYLQSKKKEA